MKAGSSGFAPAQLYTMSHHLERAQHAAVQMGPETFTLLVLRSTYAAMEFQPPIPRGYEDGWLATVAVGLGRALGFSEAPAPMARKDPEEEHLCYRNSRLKTSSAVLEMGVSNNQKWGPPQYFWMKGRDWFIRPAVKHLTPKALAEVLQKTRAVSCACSHLHLLHPSFGAPIGLPCHSEGLLFVLFLAVGTFSACM